jgi:hypothetical protein
MSRPSSTRLLRAHLASGRVHSRSVPASPRSRAVVQTRRCDALFAAERTLGRRAPAVLASVRGASRLDGADSFQRPSATRWGPRGWQTDMVRTRSDQGCALTDRVTADDVYLAREETSGHTRGQSRAGEVSPDRVANDEDETAVVARVGHRDVGQRRVATDPVEEHLLPGSLS